jgi:hypothetical protein
MSALTNILRKGAPAEGIGDFAMFQKTSATFLVELSDRQLMNLFTVTAASTLSQRAKAVLTELLDRGYFFDLSQLEFLTAPQWQLRYQEAPPENYYAYWQHHHQPLTPHLA